MITSAQCRAARGLLNWTQDDLAKAAQVAEGTVRQFEADKAAPRNATLKVIRQAFEDAGVDFLSEGEGGSGVMLKVHASTGSAADKV